MSVLVRILRPLRNSVAPSRTEPCNTGGRYCTAMTRPICTKARACFIACQPPASIKSRSVMTISAISVKTGNDAAIADKFKAHPGLDFSVQMRNNFPVP